MSAVQPTAAERVVAAFIADGAAETASSRNGRIALGSAAYLGASTSILANEDLTDTERVRSLRSLTLQLARVHGSPLADDLQAVLRPPCIRCGGVNGRHGLVHRRHDAGGGGVNYPCPLTPPARQAVLS